MNKDRIMDEKVLPPAGGYHLFNRISFWLNGEAVTAEIPPAQTTLEYLHEQRTMFGTKCSCNEGDCGACTVVVARAVDGRIVYEAVNSCLYTAARLHGKHLITIEGLGTPEMLHPIQKALLDYHGSQCGYCTPGFVMSLFALFASPGPFTKESILAALEGNLCRCTGYTSILDAADHIAATCSRQDIVPLWCDGLEAELLSFSGTAGSVLRHSNKLYPCVQYEVPESTTDLRSLMAENPGYTIISGGTDVMVQMNIQRRNFPVLIDISALDGMSGVEIIDGCLRIGANVTYSYLQQHHLVAEHLPVLKDWIGLIASKQIRNFGTLAGNIANASPIGDSMPLLLVLETSLELEGVNEIREIPLRDFFLGYRKTALQELEIIRAVKIPIPAAGAFIRARKAAKRKAVDISSVASAVRIELSETGTIHKAYLALGGMAAVPILSVQFRKAMQNMELQGLHPVPIADFVAAEFDPISDVRGSADYRRKAMRNHVLAYLEEFLEGRQQ
jgi:xanthine dehydrogenase small subunit